MRLSENRSDRSVERENVDGDHGELFYPVQFDRMAEQTKSRVVDDKLDLHSFRGQTRGNGCRRHRDVRGQHEIKIGAVPPAVDDFARQCRKAIPASVNQG